MSYLLSYLLLTQNIITQKWARGRGIVETFLEIRALRVDLCLQLRVFWHYSNHHVRLIRWYDSILSPQKWALWCVAFINYVFRGTMWGSTVDHALLRHWVAHMGLSRVVLGVASCHFFRVSRSLLVSSLNKSVLLKFQRILEYWIEQMFDSEF